MTFQIESNRDTLGFTVIYWYLVVRESIMAGRTRHHFPRMEKFYDAPGRIRHLFTIPVKDSHLFKITESVLSFYLKFHNFK